jgi:5-formyltetrahydrofolate cyclo-ligase
MSLYFYGILILEDPVKLRKGLRSQRRALSPRDQRLHSSAMSSLLCRSPLFLNSKRIALYLEEDGEMATGLILTKARKLKKQCYLPVLRPRPQQALWFAEYRPGDRLLRNRFHIEEPCIHTRHLTPPWGLDLILLPLVAFDPQGNRLGMGGGYYDRTLAYLASRKFWRKPKLIGIAHELQKVNILEKKVWDIPLDGVVTEEELYLAQGITG